MGQVVDYSWGRVGGSDRTHARAIADAGYVGAMRYLCYPDRGKRLERPELDLLHAAGLAVGVVWETTASRSGQGRDAGRADAVEANRQAGDLGFPMDRPIFYAVDFDADPNTVAPYFAGCADVGGRPVGVYGSYRIVEALGLDWCWQCAAWSGNGQGSGGSIQGRRLSRRARLFQRVGYVLGDTCDVNDVLADDWGGWHPDQRKKDWFEMATEDDLRRIVTEVVQAEMRNQDARTAAVLGSQLQAILHQLAPRTTDDPVARDLLERVVNATKA